MTNNSGPLDNTTGTQWGEGYKHTNGDTTMDLANLKPVAVPTKSYTRVSKPLMGEEEEYHLLKQMAESEHHNNTEIQDRDNWDPIYYPIEGVAMLLGKTVEQLLRDTKWREHTSTKARQREAWWRISKNGEEYGFRIPVKDSETALAKAIERLDQLEKIYGEKKTPKGKKLK